MSTPGTRSYISRSEEGKTLQASHNPPLRVTAGMELWSSTPGPHASPGEPGPHHESAAGVGELPVGTGLAERTHLELLFALTDLLPAGRGRSIQQGSAQTLTITPWGGGDTHAGTSLNTRKMPAMNTTVPVTAAGRSHPV